MPGALYRLAHFAGLVASGKRAKSAAEARVYAEVASRLRQFVDGVRDVSVDRDVQRRLLTVRIADAAGAVYPASTLSDGALRFLALTVLSLWPEADLMNPISMVCIEEPENGLSPDRIPALIHLLRDIATDTTASVGRDNPLRQVIFTTHSPLIVTNVSEDSLLVAQRVLIPAGPGRSSSVVFAGLPDTWRQLVPNASSPAPLGALLAYLSPTPAAADAIGGANGHRRLNEQRIVDREDLLQLGVVGRHAR